IEVNRVGERKEENQGHACETQEDAEEEEVVLWEFGSEDEEEPPALAIEWARVFKEMPNSIAEDVSRLFCKFIEKEGREKIWKPQCERTVEWEKQQGITERRKHKPPEERPRSQLQQIYGQKPRANECECGRPLAEHEEGRCPGVQNDTLAADRAVIEALQGRRRMDIMEKRGAMTVKEFETEDT
ncbi:hypothetical protein BGZ90_002309, partial [Linnemannia elongata]